MNDYKEIGKNVILQEAKALEKLSQLLDDSFHEAVDTMMNTKGKVIVSGVGKAGLVGQKISASLSSLGTPSFFMHPSEAAHGDIGMVEKKDTLLLISNSGNSEEIITLIPILKKIGSPIISITSKKESKLALSSNITLWIGDITEACSMNLAPSTSTTTIIALGDALAITIMKLKNFNQQNFGFYHPAGNLGKRLMLIKEIMDPNPVTVSPKETISDVILKISKKNSGSAVIVNDKKVIAIFTDGDLRRVINNKLSLETPIIEVSTKNPIILKDNIYRLEALKVMKKNKIKDIPITNENNELVGLAIMSKLII